MEYTKIGRIRPVYRGAWSPDTAYTVLDTVIAADGRASYMAKKDVPAGTAHDNDEYWGVVLDASGVIQAAEQAVGEVRAEASRKANPLEASAAGNPVQIYPDAGSILKPVSVMNPVQPGSGDPYPAGGGKNLIPYPYEITTKTINGVTMTDNGDGSLTFNGTSTDVAWFHLFKSIEICNARINTNAYKASASGDFMFSISDAAVPGLELWYYGSTTGQLSVKITAADVVFDNVTIHPMIEAGNAKTAWQPYENIRPITGRTDAQLTRSGEGGSDAFTLDFGQTVYGGTLDWNKGVLTAEFAMMALTGTESWSEENSIFYRIYLPDVEAGINIHHVSSHFAKITYSTGDAGTGYGTNITYTGLRVYAKNLFPTLDEWTSYLAAQKAAGTPVQVCYKLASPVTIQLTPQQILALDGVNTLQCDCDSMTVTYNKSLIKAFEEALARIAALEAAATTT